MKTALFSSAMYERIALALSPCGHRTLSRSAAIKDGLVGCTDGCVGKSLCGLTVEVHHGDLPTARVVGDEGYPRTLVMRVHLAAPWLT